MKNLSTDALIKFAWDLADLIDSAVQAEDEGPWLEWARMVERQAREMLDERRKAGKGLNS